jgi:hypothetical protein
MKIWYFENTHRDESNDILYDIIYLCILVEKCSQSKLGQNCTFSNGSSIAGRREYYAYLFRKFQAIEFWWEVEKVNSPKAKIKVWRSCWCCFLFLTNSVSGILKWGCSAAFIILLYTLFESSDFILKRIGASIFNSWATYIITKNRK